MKKLKYIHLKPFRVSLIGLITLILTSSVPIANFPGLFQRTQVLAQVPAGRKAQADLLLKQGFEQYQSSHYTAALPFLQQALIIYHEIKDSLGENNTLRILGLIYYELGDNAKAIDYQQQSFSIAHKINDYEGEGLSLVNLGLAYMRLEDHTKAINYYQQSLAISRKFHIRYLEGQSLGQLAIVYYNLGDYVKAIDYYQQSLVIARELHHLQTEEESLDGLGLVYYELGDYVKAIDYYQQSLTIIRKLTDRQTEGESLDHIGNAYRMLGKYDQATQYNQQALNIAREVPNRRGEGESLGNLGLDYYHLAKYDQAIDYYQQALAIAREVPNRRGEGNILGNLGIVYDSMGNEDKAIYYHQQALAIAREIQDHRGESHALNNLGLVYDSLGEYAKSIDYFQQALTIAHKFDDPQTEEESQGNLGIVFFDLGDFDQAVKCQNESLKIAQNIKNHQGEGQSQGNLGLAYFAQGKYNEAISSLQQSLAIARQIPDRQAEGESLGNLGLAYFAQGKYDEAISFYQQSLAIAREIKDRPTEGKALGNLGNVYYVQGKYDKAIDYQKQRLAIAREIKDPKEEGAALNDIGETLRKSGHLSEAEKILYQGIEVWESLRRRLLNNDRYKISIFEQQAITYRTLQKILIAENKPNEALEVSERGRSRAFVELLSSHLSNKNRYPVDKPTILLLQKIAKQHNETLVQYSIMRDDVEAEGKRQPRESELYIWVIKPTGEITFRQVDIKHVLQNEYRTLVELVNTSRAEIGITEPGITERAAMKSVPKPGAAKTQLGLQKLHKLLIEPIADLLPKDDQEKVVFIPQESLFFVPFPALQDDQNKYLIEKHTILTAPSIQVLDLTNHQKIDGTDTKIPPEEVLVVGNPTMPIYPITKLQLLSLNGAEQEAKDIAKLFNTQAITGGKATKANIIKKMSNARIIHLATHGLIDDLKEFGVPGAIALAPDGQDDGFLTSWEILNLKLKAKLVVLSACNTGSGRITGDGIIGLSRSLMTAGVPSVIVSLWSINDKSTSSLMTEFYKNLLHKEDKATALRNAMITTMKEEKHHNPFYWAAFTLIGETK